MTTLKTYHPPLYNVGHQTLAIDKVEELHPEKICTYLCLYIGKCLYTVSIHCSFNKNESRERRS
jgi:hypothetical protein